MPKQMKSSLITDDRATELRGESGSDVWIREAPAHVIRIIFMPSAPATDFDTAPAVPFVHFVQPFTEAMRRHGHFNDVRNARLLWRWNGLCSGTSLLCEQSGHCFVKFDLLV